MAERKPFLLRIDSAVLEAVQRWANDDLRSLNAQIEFVLRDALAPRGTAAAATQIRKTRSADPEDPRTPRERATSIFEILQ